MSDTVPIENSVSDQKSVLAMVARSLKQMFMKQERVESKELDVKVFANVLHNYLSLEYSDIIPLWQELEQLGKRAPLTEIFRCLSSDDTVYSYRPLTEIHMKMGQRRRLLVALQGELMILDGIREGNVYFSVFNLEKGWLTQNSPVGNFLKQYRPIFIQIKVKNPAKVPFGWGWFWALLNVNKKIFVSAVLCSISVGLLSLALPFYFQIVVDKFLSYANYESLYSITIGVVIAFIFLNLFEYFRNENINFLSKQLDAHIVKRVSARFLELSLQHVKAYKVGVLNKHLNQTTQIRQFFSHNLAGVFFDLISLLVVFPVLFFLSGKLFIAVVFFCLLLAGILAGSMRLYRKKLDKLYASEAARESFVVETIQCLSMIKSVNMERKRLDAWHDRAADSIENDYSLNRLDAAISLALEVCQNGLTLVIIFVGVLQVYAGDLTVGTLVAFNMLVGKVTQPTLKLATLVHHVQKVNLAIDMLSNVMKGSVEVQDGQTVDLQGDFEVEQLNYFIPGTNKQILNNLNFEIKAGEFIGIVGSSGAGKSTLSAIIQGIYRDYQGSVKISGIELHSLSCHELRRQIGILQQKADVLADTVENNVVAGRTIDRNRVMEGLHFAYADEFLDRLPEGINSRIEEGGSNFSGGELQRIGLARAVYGFPKLLILDEATSSLDAESEAAVIKHLMQLKGKCTILLITHRLSNLIGADNILVLEKGHLVEQGRHANLLQQNNGRYRELWNTQTLHAVDVGQNAGSDV